MRSLMLASMAMFALAMVHPAFAQSQPGPKGEVLSQIPPGITEAQPWQPAAPHGQGIERQGQATRAQDSAAGEIAGQQVQ